jgi:signal transduction histidine kinase
MGARATWAVSGHSREGRCDMVAGAKVLVVEDESIVALDLRKALTGLGYSVPAVAASGEEAIRKAAEACPDLVLMDIRLRGGMSGIEAAEDIRARFGIPVVYLTALADESTVQWARKTEPFGYLIKPFDERDLYVAIEMALNRHRLETALKESESRLRLYSERLRILHEVDQAILGAGSLETIANSALRRVRQLIPCQRVSVVVFDLENWQAKMLAVHGADVGAPGAETCEPLSRQRVRELRQRATYIKRDLQASAHLSDLDRALLDAGMRHVVVVPLITEGELVGALRLATGAPSAFDGEQLEIACEVADSLALAIHQARLREQLERHVAELEAHNEELDAYAHTVAHDLRDPLTLVIGFADALEKNCSALPDEELRKGLGSIVRGGRKMETIIQELLVLAEVRKLEKVVEPLDMAHIVAEAQQRLSHLVEENQAEVSLPDTWPIALGHGPWVEEVWVNYLSNAIKYGGQPPRVKLGATVQEDGQVRFWVQDNGGGIPPEVQARLFTPFTKFSQDRAAGSGLGLSIVLRIVEKLGGRVGVESEEGRGSVFSFTLPAAAD